MSRTFFLDLDRTVFQTDKAAEIFEAIAAHYPDKPGLADGYHIRQQYYTYPFIDNGDSVTYFHDATKWLSDNELDPVAAYQWLATSPLADGRFEYEGVRTLVAALQRYGEVKVLTFGEDAYQRAKATLCPSLSGLEVVTTLEPKGEYLAHHAAAGDWIIDDKAVQDLPSGVRLVQVDHTGLTKGQGVVSSLAAAKVAIENALTK